MSYSLDGVDDLIASGTETLGSIFTFMVWVNPATLGELDRGFLIANSAGGNARVQFGFTNSPVVNTITHFANRTVDGRWNGPANQVAFNVWQCVAVTIDGSGSASPLFYYNGQPIAVTQEVGPPSGGYSADGNPIYLGNSSDGLRAIPGLLGQAVIWKRILTPVEIANVYVIGPGLYPDYDFYFPCEWASKATIGPCNQQFPRGGQSLTTVGALPGENPPGWRPVGRRG